MRLRRKRSPQEEAAYRAGAAEAKKKKQERRVAKAWQRGYEKGMKGRGIVAGLKTAGHYAGRVVDECAKFSEGIEKANKRMEAQQRKKKKRQADVWSPVF